MKIVLSAEEMREADRETVEEIGIPSKILIERAALALAREAEKLGGGKTAGVLAGTGQNGADGICAARILESRGIGTLVCIIGNKDRFTEDAAFEYGVAERTGVRFTDNPAELSGCSVLIDALFGTGLDRDIEGRAREAVLTVNGMRMPKIASDIPSGIDATTGQKRGVAVQCTETVTFGCLLRGLLFSDGRKAAGHVLTEDVGIRCDKKHGAVLFDAEDAARLLPRRDPAGNKGTFGKVLCIAGNDGMAGAAFFAASAASASGAGLVKVLTAEKNRQILQTLLPEAVLSAADMRSAPEVIKRELAWADTVLIGPGLGTGTASVKLLDLVLSNLSCPVVVDADGLNIMAKNPGFFMRPHLAMIITPHPGEMARLTGTDVPYITDHMIEAAEDFARDNHVTTVLKNATTVTSVPFVNTYINILGNDGMAKGGSGDTLSGLITGLIASGTDPDNAAPLGVFLHASAGDIAAQKKGHYGMTARDICDALPEAFQKIEEGE